MPNALLGSFFIILTAAYHEDHKMNFISSCSPLIEKKKIYHHHILANTFIIYDRVWTGCGQIVAASVANYIYFVKIDKICHHHILAILAFFRDGNFYLHFQITISYLEN